MQLEVSTEPPAANAAAAAKLNLKQVAQLGTATASQLYLHQKVFQLQKRKLALTTQTASDAQSRCDMHQPSRIAVPLLGSGVGVASATRADGSLSLRLLSTYAYNVSPTPSSEGEVTRIAASTTHGQLSAATEARSQSHALTTSNQLDILAPRLTVWSGERS